MSTPNQPAGATQGTFQIVGGTMVVPPQPDEPVFPLRREQFQTLCEGEMSEGRSIRDACVGAFVTGAVGIAGLYFTIDWDSAISHGRKAPFVVLSFLCVLTIATLVVGWVEKKRIARTRTGSAYSRLIQTVSGYFNIPVRP
jgi:hypothetical protein